MDYKYEHICKMKQPVLCELCNKSYAIGVMKKHKQTKMHIENAKNHGVPSSMVFLLPGGLLEVPNPTHSHHLYPPIP